MFSHEQFTVANPLWQLRDDSELGRFGNRVHMVSLSLHFDNAIVRHRLERTRKVARLATIA
jgi:hypothetical protein